MNLLNIFLTEFVKVKKILQRLLLNEKKKPKTNLNELFSDNLNHSQE